MYILIFVLFITFMHMWYLTANQFYVKNYAPNLDSKGMCSSVISLIWKKTAECCPGYDEKYAYGGNRESRKAADYQLKSCALEHGIEEKSATVLFYTARRLGTPYIDTPWRWGYGYDFGKGYRE